MTFQSGHRTFDAAVNNTNHGYIGTGNVSTPTQRSGFIRRLTETECNGFTFKPGHLRDYDMRPFMTAMPRQVRDVVMRETMTRDVILYRFFHRDGRDQVEHGWIVTDRAYRELFRMVTGPTRKSASVIDAAARRVCTGNDK